MKKNLILASAFALFTLAAVSTVQAAPTTCAIAGDYQGKYNGDDHGFIAVSVSAADGTLTGRAQSQPTGATFAVGGVINSDGTLTTGGAVSSGAQFSGRFVSGVASGQWSHYVTLSDGSQRLLTGNWGVERVAPDADCD